jgi:serine/threonine protein kinase
MVWFAKRVGGEYELGKTIGRGHFSKVKIGVHVRTKQQVAVKVMERKALQDENMEEQVKREIAIMRKLNHPNITKLFDVFQTRRHVYLILELVTGGELFDKIVQCKRFTEEMGRKYFQQLVLGTLYCHLHGVAHRDLKPENLMLDQNGDLKISDFGLSNLQPTSGSGNITQQLKTMCGTPEYVAPEVLSGTGYSGFTADCWSCGVILYVMLAGQLPFRDTNASTVFHKIRAAQFEMKPYFSAGAKDLISKLLVVDCNKRFTLEQVVEHEWFAPGFDKAGLDKIREGAASGLGVDSAEIQRAITLIDEEESSPLKSPASSDAPASPNNGEVDMVDTLHRRASFARSSFVERNTRFGMRGTPEAASTQLVEALTTLKLHPDAKGNPTTIKCSTETENGVITFTVLVTKSPTQADVAVVEIRRGRGPTLEFNEIYCQIVEKLDTTQVHA